MSEFQVLPAHSQIAFYYGLKVMRDQYLSIALDQTLKNLEPDAITRDIKEFVPKPARSLLATHAVREERLFCLPCVIHANPRLLGYYRLLYGISQKQFYDQGPFGQFKHLEITGKVAVRVAPRIDALCLSLSGTAMQLVDGIDTVSQEIIHELQIMAIGAQLRGGANTLIGQEAAKQIKELITDAVRPHVIEDTDLAVVINNSSGRKVVIQIASDPDLTITEVLLSANRPLVAIEVKGGRDLSNVHNRIGEAEKSHQKARAAGFPECWTIINVRPDAVSLEVLARESPSSSRFFHLSRLLDISTTEYRDFIDLVRSVASVPDTPAMF